MWPRCRSKGCGLRLLRASETASFAATSDPMSRSSTAKQSLKAQTNRALHEYSYNPIDRRAGLPFAGAILTEAAPVFAVFEGRVFPMPALWAFEFHDYA